MVVVVTFAFVALSVGLIGVAAMSAARRVSGREAALLALMTALVDDEGAVVDGEGVSLTKDQKEGSVVVSIHPTAVRVGFELLPAARVAHVPHTSTSCMPFVVEALPNHTIKIPLQHVRVTADAPHIVSSSLHRVDPQGAIALFFSLVAVTRVSRDESGGVEVEFLVDEFAERARAALSAMPAFAAALKAAVPSNPPTTTATPLLATGASSPTGDPVRIPVRI